MERTFALKVAFLGLCLIVASSMAGRVIDAEQARLDRESFQQCVAANERVAQVMASADRKQGGLDLLRYEPMDCRRTR